MSSQQDGRLSSLDRVVTAELLELPSEQLTPEVIRSAISDYLSLPKFAEVAADEAEQLARTLETRHAVRLSIGGVVQLKHEPWLPDAKAAIDPYFWGRYKSLSASKGLGVQVLATLDEVSDRILGLLGNPRQTGAWDRRGLVLGNVQSGKTANYLGLICKASDAGYRVIIVIAGIHNNLRNQTQSRIDEGFIGYEKGASKNKLGKVVGVGRLNLTRRPSHFTSSTRDFSQAAATQVGVPLQNLSEPAVFVIKKNASTLANLLEWLQTSLQGGRINSPVLIIDDEADNASINVGQDPASASKINAQIRQVLSMFERSSYVGYTATPFANIFIDPDSDDDMIGQDLFPRDFIVSLDSPTNYLGAERVFLESPGQFLRTIDDSEELLPVRHKINHSVDSIPDSLRIAVRAFLLARAIRMLRNHVGAHNSMLVNASRFTKVQSQIRNQIHAYLEELQNALRLYGSLPPDEAELHAEIGDLKNTWNSEYRGAGEPWPEILGCLYESAAPVGVVEINSRSAGVLNYAEFENGLNVIAVGGFSLSRGLTLEGLSITYFLRNSIMYDTLMQMGRWFGYRPGYEDLCRIWLPEDAQGWYAHIAESIEMLRSDLKEMEAAGATPAEFGLRVRSHPDALIVTARNKMGTGQKYLVSVGLGGALIETTPVSSRSAGQNVARAVRFVEQIHGEVSPSRATDGWVFNDVSADAVASFIRDYKGDPGSTKTQREPVLGYIRDRAESTLKLWDVLLVSKADAKEPLSDLINDGRATSISGLGVIYPERTAGTRSTATSVHIGNNQKVASRGSEKAGLSPEQVRIAEETYRARRSDESEAPRNIPDAAYRLQGRKPLLILHFLRIKDHDAGGHVNLPRLVATWGITFPKPPPYPPEKRVEFVVNTVWYQEHFGRDADDEVEAEGND